jgi:hypothetical protein
MEGEEKSGLQMSLGDFVSLFRLCCAFGVPELIFLGVRRLAGPQLPHRQLSAQWTAYTTHIPPQTCTHLKKYIAILSKET